MTCGAAPWFARVFGCLCVFLVPAILLQCLFKRDVAPLVPSSVSQAQLLELLFSLILTGLPFTLPVVVAQLVCLTGQRGRFSKWSPSKPAPGAQFATRSTRGEEALMVTGSVKES